MDRELEFARMLEQLKRTAREQGGYIERFKVEEAFRELSLSGEQLEMVFDYLKKSNIGIDVPLKDDEVLMEQLTGEERNYIRNYYEDLERLPIYSDGEKRAFTISAMAGEEDAQQKMIEIYLRDVAQIAKLYTGQGVCVEDLIGEGNLALTAGSGMLGSLESPDEAEGMLIKLVMDAMEELIKADADSERTGKRALERVNKVNDKAKELSETYGRDVTVEELVAETGLSEKAVMDAMRISAFQIEKLLRNGD